MPRLTADERANRDHWDRDARGYRRRHHGTLTGDIHWGVSLPTESELRILGDLRGKDVLEVGCGQGEAVLHAKTRLGARRAAGVDLSAAQIAFARLDAAEAGAEVEFVVTPASDLSAFRDRSFDVVFSAGAMGFFPDLDAVFRACARVLRPRGLLAFSWTSPLWQLVEWDARDVRVTESYFARRVHRDPGDGAGPWTEFRRTYGDYVRLLREAGFDLVDVVEPPPARHDPHWTRAYPLRVMRKVPAFTIWKAEKRTAPRPRSP